MRKHLSAWRQSKDIAHVAPFVVFMSFLMVLQVLDIVGFTNEESGTWYRRMPLQWVYPLQTVVTLFVLWWFRRHYEFRPVRGLGFAIMMAVVGIAIWIAPGWAFRHIDADWGVLRYIGFAPRRHGFDPTSIQAAGPVWLATAIGFRFLRMVVAVALTEEIFWRGFLMRYLVDSDGDHWEVPFGTHRWFSFVVVTGAFVFVHQPVDFVGSAVYGALAYVVAVRTKSLTACVVMHAVANLLLGLYVMQTQQWGYW